MTFNDADSLHRPAPACYRCGDEGVIHYHDSGPEVCECQVEDENSHDRLNLMPHNFVGLLAETLDLDPCSTQSEVFDAVVNLKAQRYALMGDEAAIEHLKKLQ